MTTQPPNQPPYPYQPQPMPPHKAPKRHGKLKVAGAAVVGLLVGIGIGSAGNSTGAVPEPKTETVTEQVTPQACLDALEAAERLVHRSVVPAFDAAADAMDAASRFDVYGIEAATAKMNRLTPRTERLIADYNSAADECRSAS